VSALPYWTHAGPFFAVLSFLAWGCLAAWHQARRLQRINQAIWTMGQGGDFSGRLQLPGRDGIAQLAQRLDALAATLQQQQTTRLGRFASTASVATDSAHRLRQVAHDMGSPLAALAAVGTQAAGMDPALRELLEEAVQRLRHMAQALLPSHRPAGPRPQPLLPLLRAVVAERRLLQRSGDGPEVRLSVGPRGQEAVACLAAEPFKQAMANLLDNAAQASGNDAPIQVHLEVEDGRCHVRLVDRGCGISGSQLRHVGQLGFSANKPNGHGLGVHAARQVVEQLGGELRLLSIAGVGTTAHICLPSADGFSSGAPAALAALRSASF
jgi:two-component system sensor histidine kinase BaeS